MAERLPLATMHTLSSRSSHDSHRSKDSQDLPAALLIGGATSFAFVVNNISGPGMLDFPQAFQAAGWAVAVPAILGIAATSAAVASSLADAHARLRLAARGDVEFSELFGAVYDKRVFRTMEVCYLLNLFSQNVAAIVATAQATDALFGTAFGSSYAVVARPGLPVAAWAGCDVREAACAPFDEAPGGVLLTAGYVFCALTLAPLGFVSLHENMLAQKISFVLLVALLLQFLAYFATQRDGTVEAIGAKPWDVVGVVIFNFAFCVTIPSWLNEKRPSVPTKTIIWSSCLTSALIYCAVGWLGGLAFANASDNVLTELAGRSAPRSVQLGAGFFAFFIIGLGVPVFCVLMRYNLLAGGASPFTAHLVGGAAPWLVSWLVYRGHGVLHVLAWSGLFLNAGVDFLAPMILVLKTAETKRDRRSAALLLVVVSLIIATGLGLKSAQEAVEGTEPHDELVPPVK